MDILWHKENNIMKYKVGREEGWRVVGWGRRGGGGHCATVQTVNLFVT